MYRGRAGLRSIVRAPGLPRVETQPVGRARWPSAEAFQAVKSCALEMRLRTRETRPRTLSVV